MIPFFAMIDILFSGEKKRMFQSKRDSMSTAKPKKLLSKEKMEKKLKKIMTMYSNFTSMK